MAGCTPILDRRTFARQMVTKYQTLLLENAGTATVNVDGQSISYQVLEDLYDRWQRKLLIAMGKSGTVSRIRLDRF